MGIFDPLMDYIQALENRIKALEDINAGFDNSAKVSKKFQQQVMDCATGTHTWAYKLNHSECIDCQKVCICEFTPSKLSRNAIINYKDCIHCKRQVLA